MIRNWRLFALGLLVLASSTTSLARLIEADPHFEGLDISDGLPTNRIEGIVQDQLGYVWIATANGLVRHDGHELIVLRHDPLDPESLPGNNIQAILAAESGSVWIAISGQGVFELQGLEIIRSWPTADHDGPLRPGFIWAIQEDCNGDIWLMFATGGLVRIDVETGAIENYSASSYGIEQNRLQLDLLVDSQCRFWLLNGDGAWLSSDSDEINFNPVLKFDNSPIQQGIGLHETAEQQIFMAGLRGVLRLELPDAQGRSMVSTEMDALWVPTESSALDMTDAGPGQLWIGLNEGIALLDTASHEINYFGRSRAGEKRSPLQQSQRLLRDTEGSLWVGSFRHSIWRLPPQWSAFRKFVHTKTAQQESNQFIQAVTAYGGVSHVLYLTPSGEIFLSDLSAPDLDGAIDATRIGSAGTSMDVYGLHADEDWVWLYSLRELVRLNRESGDQEMLREFELGQTIRFFTPAEDGNFWLGGFGNSLELVDIEGKTIQRWMADEEDTDAFENQLSVQRGLDGYWWLLSPHGIYRLYPDGGFERIFHRPALMQSAMAVQDDSIWLAGDSFLEQLRWHEGQLVSERRFFAQDGLPVQPILRVFPQGDQIWLLLEAGVAQLDISESSNNSFRVFSSTEGLPASRFRANAATMLASNQIVASVADGLLLIDPEVMNGMDQPPPVHITSIRAGELVMNFDPNQDEELTLNWQQNSFEISFTALSYLNPVQNEYRVRLTGWEEQWHSQTGQNRRYYSNLPPGTYRFEVQAASASGTWNRQGAQLQLVIPPPPWLSGWALLVYGLIGLMLLFFAWRALTSHRKRQHETRRAREQQALARSQRDFLHQLNQSLEPEFLARTIGQSVLSLIERPTGWFGYRSQDLPQALIALGNQPANAEFSVEKFKQRILKKAAKDVIYLNADEQSLAAIWVPDLNETLDAQRASELDLLTQVAAQVIQNARLLISVREYASKAEQANQAKSDFLATMSHEIRTPLHGLLGMIDLLATEQLSPQHFEMLRTMRTSGSQLQRILNDILDLSRIEANRIELHDEPFEVVELLEQAVELHAANANVNGLDLRLQMASDLPTVAIGDADRLAQVIGNLLSNAIKFTDRGAIEVQSWLGEDDSLNIAVSDTGPGIDSASQATLFQPFTQLEASSTRRHSGTGLGLAICRRIVEEMGGRIDLHSRVGKGSRFTLRLPLDGMRKQPARDIQILKGYRLGVAVSAPYARILLRMCRRWSLSLVQTTAEQQPLDGIVVQAGFFDQAQLQQWLADGIPVWQLSSPSRDAQVLHEGVESLRLPLITSRLVAALIDRKIGSE